MTIPMRLAALLLAACAPALGSPPEQEAELGRVAWGRDHDAALAASARTGKPVFVLFQEIPGCATCKGFGRGPLSNPLLVDAIEAEFVPLLVHNNRGGRDGELLERYREPAWNNPVVRFLGRGGEDVLPRVDGVYSEAAVAERMVRALEAARRPVSRYLAIALEEARCRAPERAVFAMPCFWRGEAALGGIEGVLATEAGFLGRREVVDVRFDPARIGAAGLLERARALGVADRAWVAGKSPPPRGFERLAEDPRPARASDRKYHLRRSAYRFVPMSPQQAARANSLLERGGDPAEVLSPYQAALLERISRDPNGARDLADAVTSEAAWAAREAVERALSSR